MLTLVYVSITQLFFFKVWAVGLFLNPQLGQDQYTALHLASTLWPVWHGWADHHLKAHSDFFQSIRAESSREFQQPQDSKQPQTLSFSSLCVYYVSIARKGSLRGEFWREERKWRLFQFCSPWDGTHTCQHFSSQCHTSQGMINSFLQFKLVTVHRFSYYGYCQT